MQQIRLAILAVAVVGLTGCATMFASGNDNVRLESEPAGATVTTQNGQNLGTTPLTASLKPNDYLLRFAMEGYQEQTFALGKKVDGIAFLNLLCVLCWGLDFATGAVWGLEEDYVKVDLSPAANGEEGLALHDLACHNYASLEVAVKAGTIGEALATSADRIVANATGVDRSSCSTSGL